MSHLDHTSDRVGCGGRVAMMRRTRQHELRLGQGRREVGSPPPEPRGTLTGMAGVLFRWAVLGLNRAAPVRLGTASVRAPTGSMRTPCPPFVRVLITV